MTTALCLSCGDLKFGAFCECSNCGFTSSGNMQVDMTFSDHNYDPQTLSAFGKVIKAIAKETTRAELRYLAFLLYITKYFPEILEVKPPANLMEELEALIESMVFPAITLKISNKFQLG